MIVTLPSQERVDEITRRLAPDVIRIRVNTGLDWSEHPALYFRVILSDEASQADRLADVTAEITTTLYNELGLAELDHIPYFRFRSESEQEKLKEKGWD
jgi:hypothetical protein